jgi:hypothetical protein
MPTVLIIGFSYGNLSATITDIYYAYSYYARLGYQIHIGTDLIEKINIGDYIGLLSNQSVDDQFVPFVKTTFYQQRKIVIDRDSLLSWFNSIIITTDRNLIVYYTGHGVENHIVLPDNTNFSASDFRSSILRLSNERNILINEKNANILVIIDCCNPHGLFLPFKFNRESKCFYHTNNNFVLPKMIVITSSEPDTQSQALRLESPFTKYFFSHIADQTNSYDIGSICDQIDLKMRSNDKINSGQTCTAYVSYPSLLVLWSWTVSNKLNIKLNNQLDSLMICQ